MDKELNKKIEENIKVVMGISIAKPSLLIHAGDEWCWLQFYIAQYLKKYLIVFIQENKRDEIIVKGNENVIVYYWNSVKDIKEKTVYAVKQYLVGVK